MAFLCLNGLPPSDLKLSDKFCSFLFILRMHWTELFVLSVCSGPCDIIGDVSYEELRAAAYDDYKRGLSLQSIVRKIQQTAFPLFCLLILY